LLVVVMLQVKALSERVRQIEDAEFSKVQTEVELLRSELFRLRGQTELAEKELGDATDTLKVVNNALGRARHGAPELSKAISDAHTASEAVKNGLPSPDVADDLSRSVKTASEEATQTRNRLSEVESKLPEATQASELTASLDAQQKRVDALGAALPRSDQVGALAKQLDADVSALIALRNGIPGDDQLQALRRELSRAHEMIAHLGVESKSNDSKPAEPRGSEAPGGAAHSAQ
jgi:chromosome segregation ATPase